MKALMPLPNIGTLYPATVAEGEGIGTAYEYYVKWKKLARFTRELGRPRSMLVAGLPERYGLSMDFLLLSQALDMQVTVVDDRRQRLEQCQQAAQTLQQEGFFSRLRARFEWVANLAHFNLVEVEKARFGLAVSCEVVQRIPEVERMAYVTNLRKHSDALALFAPNSGNKSHATLSGLCGVSRDELVSYCEEAGGSVVWHDQGYIDLPPFPPGLSRSADQRERAMTGRLERTVMQGLQIYSIGENLLPEFIKVRLAHIVYAMLRFA